MENKTITINYKAYPSATLLPPNEQTLLAGARKALEAAYAPYSRFHVGCAVQLSDGTMVMGSNQENSAYPSGLCAERVALFATHAQYPGQDIKAIAVCAKSLHTPLLHPVTPCGACRQVMVESSLRQPEPFKVILAGEDGEIFVFENALDLTPLYFGPSSLG